jgi:hypothetical protein
MASAEPIQITGPGGLRGTIAAAAWPLDSRRAEVLVQFEGGASMLVPRKALARQDDGSYRLTLDSAMFERRGAGGRVSDAPIALPVTQEALAVHTTPVETGHVRIRKEEIRITKRRVETHMPQRVTLRREEAVVERVNREGDETIPST